MLTAKEIAQNLKDVEYAVGQQRLEGLEVEAAVIEDMKKMARGEITSAECIARTRKRYMNVDKVF